jgi:copper transport protein
VAFAWLAVLAPAADAHALLVASLPAADATLPASPSRIILTFSEPSDPVYSKAYVLDSHGSVAPGVSRLQAVKGSFRQLSLTVSKPLPKGWYTVQWLSLSAIDGHAADGLFTFGVGVTPPKVSPFGTVEGTSTALTSLAAVGRWLLYAGLALLLGGAVVGLLVLGGKLPAGWRPLLRSGWLAATLGAGAMTLAEEHIVGAHRLLPMFQTPAGHNFYVLDLLVIFGCGVAVVVVDLFPHKSTLWVLAAVVAVVLLAHAQGGHAYAPAHLKALHVLEQWVHMTAVGIWIGGLVWLLLALRPQAGFDRPLVVGRFSRLAGYALAVVLFTGLLRALTETGSIHAVVSSSYGNALLVKIALVIVIVALGALSRYRYVPESGSNPGAVDGLRRSVRGEVFAAAGIFAATAVLSGLAPVAVGALAPSTSTTVSGSDFARTTSVSLTVSPGAVGHDGFTAKVSDYRTGGPLPAVSVQLQFALPDRPTLPQSTLPLTSSSSGTWRGVGSNLSIPGTWTVTVLVQSETTGVSVPLTLRIRSAP